MILVVDIALMDQASLLTMWEQVTLESTCVDVADKFTTNCGSLCLVCKRYVLLLLQNL